MSKLSYAAKAALCLGVALPPLAQAATSTSAEREPLVSAVNQVIPPDDLVLFASEVSQSQMVAPVNAVNWRDALSAMLQPLGLTFSEQGQLVRIGTEADIRGLGQAGYNLVAGGQQPAIKTLYQGQSVATPGFSLTSQPVGTVPQIVNSAPIPTAPQGTNSTAWLKPMNVINTPDGQLPVQSIGAAPAHPALGEKVSQLPPPTPLVSGALSSGPTAPTASASVPPTPSPQPEQVWTLQAGELASKNLMDWAEKAGWQVTWEFPKDVVIAHNATFKGSFPDAAGQVVKILRQQMQQFDPSSADIHYDEYTANHQFVVDSYNAGGK